MLTTLNPSPSPIPTNTSGLQPLGRAILVEHYEPERAGALIEIPDHIQGRMLMAEQRAVVIEIGPSCWPDEPPRCAVGDRVLVSKMAGYMAKGTADGKQYRIINDRDVFARITAEEGDNHE